ncbi:5-formyltetrahydrofolate cyclo-ligase [Geovibrio thiophilus]|uniref:5-formyltetrahydrofolate cyclo-ligase n=1 Tax=Geovibrio thiophilus TaxID=139438 RepID=A0A3R5XXE9_9BACT|nr:5-formyltetrahydrofolate cyclo-ligase [Geovibrio thiophilus]QAR33597.1 5-formyltetrahydrofolate cyclo-ligase [Geovibrio thiophilus]
MSKAALRKQMKEKRGSLPCSFVTEASDAICEKFLAEYKSAKRVLLYSDINNEVKTENLALQLMNGGTEVYLPKLKEGRLVTGPYNGGLQTGSYGVKEPIVIDDRTDFDVVAVPGLAFDSELFRLGYGGGFYDRLLPGLTLSVKAGLGYGFQIVGTVYREEHDFPLDALITENYIYRRSR